jgi:hypothetical protein
VIPHVAILMPDDLDRLVREQIEANRKVERDCEAQIAMDRCVEILHREGELELAAIVMIASAARIAGDTHSVLEMLIQYAYDEMSAGRRRR